MGDTQSKVIEVARAIDPEAWEPPSHWTVGNIKARREMAVRSAKRAIAAMREWQPGIEDHVKAYDAYREQEAKERAWAARGQSYVSTSLWAAAVAYINAALEE